MPGMKINTYLSKSLFIRGLQCHKSLYLHKYQPELKDEVSESQQALFQLGNNVGIYAQQLFPNGIEIPYDGLSISEQIEKTRAEIEKGTSTIYEAAFSYDDIFIKADILHRGADGWEIYEVKSSTGDKDVYHDDIALQYYVVCGSGLPISKTSLVYVNNQYVRNGDIEPAKLFAFADITDIIKEKQSVIKEIITALRLMLSGDEPDIDIGEHCFDPYECDFKGHCWKKIPENSVFDIKGRFTRRFELYKQGTVHFKDVPENILSDKQKIQVSTALNKKVIINPEGIRKFLDTIWYPLCFLILRQSIQLSPYLMVRDPISKYHFNIHYIMLRVKDQKSNTKSSWPTLELTTGESFWRIFYRASLIMPVSLPITAHLRYRY